MHEITTFTGGSIGDDPYSSKTWSGSSRFFCQALSRKQLLAKAEGVKLSSVVRAMFLTKNFTRDRSVWRKRYYFDPAYRNALTRAARTIQVETPFLLQIGAMFSLPAAFPGKTCFSYHDANLAVALKSGYGFDGLERKRIDQALRYEEELAQQVTSILTFSEYVRQSFIDDFRIPPERVVTVGGAVNLDTFPEADPAKEYTAKRLLFIGVDFVRKGGPELLKAFTALRETYPECELHIAGPTSIGHVLPGVHFHGHLSKSIPEQKEKLEGLFRAATLYVMPSRYEPFGIAPLEAMLYQLPCVLTDTGAFRDFVTPGLHGDLTEMGNVENLLAKLTTLVADPDALARMGRTAREMVLSRYTWDAVASRIELLVRPAVA